MSERSNILFLSMDRHRVDSTVATAFDQQTHR